MSNTLTVTFTEASPAPANGYLVRYWDVANPGAVLTTTVSSSPAVITGLSAYQYSGTIESVCGFGNSNQISFSGLLCNITFNVTTTSPTNYAGDNGTATIGEITNGSGSYSYSWNTSPVQTTQTATGLSTGVSYTATVTDTVTGCTATQTIMVGETTFTFDADYMVVTYQFSDGSDLDTRTRIVSIEGSPWVDQSTGGQYIGYGQYSRTPQSADYIESGNVCDMTLRPLAMWGGDNMGIGYESTLIDFTQLGSGQNEIVIDCRALWWGTLGNNPVNIGFTLYKGGCMIKQGNSGSPAYNYTNPTAADSFTATSASKVITAYRDIGGSATGSSDLEYPEVGASISRGQRLAVITYNRSTNVGNIDINDTTTPFV